MTKENDQRIVKSAYGVLQRLIKNLPANFLKDNELDDVVVEALKQHGDHLAVHGIVQESIDAFKLACWLGGSILDTKKKEPQECGTVINALLKTLREFLYKESEKALIVPKDTVALFKSCIVQQQKGNDRHGIWMNGLYVSFHCSLSSYKQGKAYKIAL